MQRNELGKGGFPFVICVLILVTIACSFSALQEPTATPQPPVTVIVTEIVTQIVLPTNTVSTPETSEVTPTLTATATVQPAVSGGYDPYSQPQWYPIKGCPASRLHVGDRAYVTVGGGPNGIRYGSDVRYDTIIGYAEEGEGMLIIDGPWCYYDWIVWQVTTDGGLTGYTPEGDGDEYWLLPEEE